MGMFSMIIKDSIYNLGYELSLIPTRVELALKSKLMSKAKPGFSDEEREKFIEEIREKVKKEGK